MASIREHVEDLRTECLCSDADCGECFDEALGYAEKIREHGQLEGAAIAFFLVALGEWARRCGEPKRGPWTWAPGPCPECGPVCLGH